VEVSLEPSLVGLMIQCMGIVLVAVLSCLLTRSIRRPYLDYWAMSWVCLGLALYSLLFAFYTSAPSRWLYSLYFFGEYAFGYLFVAGCRHYAEGQPLRRTDAWVLPSGILLAVLLPRLSSDFNLISLPHSAIMIGFWYQGYRSLAPARRRKKPGLGVSVMSVALVLLTVDFLNYLCVQTYAATTGAVLPFPYMKYSSLYDLILEILLGFGTIMVVMEHVCRELEAATAGLRFLAERDPLTEALNRHAFHTLLHRGPPGGGQSPGGCVAVLDLDDFKTINDTLGHCAGDAAIRAVAQALRSVIRADDLLFRWGGDEFLILLPGVQRQEVAERLDRLHAVLARTELNGIHEPVVLAISYGLATYGADKDLEASIDQADKEMYQSKQLRKQRNRAPEKAALLAAPG
jgi:diguanylate cyclase